MKRVRLAVAQTIIREAPRNSVELRESGLEMRRLMREAHGAGARLIQFPEGATCFPRKRILSITGPENVGPSDWTRLEWAVLCEELNAIARLARELKLWTIFGSVHQLIQLHRPHNSLYVVSDRGELATRYDERMLSNTKVSFMYTPSSVPVTFEVDGLRFGCSLGMESHFPEIFIEYERLGVDCVLFSTAGGVPADGSALPKRRKDTQRRTLTGSAFRCRRNTEVFRRREVSLLQADGLSIARRMEHLRWLSLISTTIRGIPHGHGDESHVLESTNRIWCKTINVASIVAASNAPWCSF